MIHSIYAHYIHEEVKDKVNLLYLAVTVAQVSEQDRTKMSPQSASQHT